MAPAGIGDSVEGVHAVAAAALAGRVTELTVERARLRSSEVQAIIDEVERRGGSIVVVDALDDAATTAAPQGVVAVAEPIAPATVRELAAGEGAFVVVLDHLQDPRNVGAIARSAAAAGATGLVVAARRAAPLSAAAFKAAAGALDRLPVAVVSSIPKALDQLRQAGLWVVGLTADGERPLFGLDLVADPVAIVIGAEGTGLGRLTAEKCDVTVAIPMAAGTESLNAATAATLACYEVTRSRVP